jgi:hypothetical protein
MERMHEVDCEIMNAKAKTNILYNLLENNLTPDGNLKTLAAGEARDLLVLLSDVSEHLNKIEETLSSETVQKAA